MKKILLLGSSGFLGKNVLSKIENNTIYTISGKDQVDLTEINALRDFTSKLEFDYIINCAAFVGGIAYGYKYPAEMLVVNSRIADNVYQIAKEKSIKMLINPIPNCVYPGKLNTYKEEKLFDGPPHDSVYFYAHSVYFHSPLCLFLFSTLFGLFWLCFFNSLSASCFYAPFIHFKSATVPPARASVRCP